MNLTRIEHLLKYLEEDPNDAFSLYALALEYKDDKPAEAERLFSQLLAAHPDYLPTYYQAAQLMETTGQVDKALKLYATGIDLAKQQNNQATLRELKAAYDLLAEG
ncbi:MAG: tetratricopeptide repeat protein [Cyclobacteriaceae bacterium]|nr:tetratricopeptide repeat protein [Cyclobacteriaceae bacterium]